MSGTPFPPDPLTGHVDLPELLCGPVVEHSAEFGVPGLVREQAGRTPNAVACADGARSLDYRELDRLSDLVADRVLAATGGRRGAVVVRLRRGVGLTTALLGVLKAGCWYVPVALAEPAARLTGMAADAVPVAVVRDGEPVPESLAHLPAVWVPERCPADVPPRALPAVAVDQPVYVLFTSGSTGAPKGVVLGSGALCNRLLWMQRQYGLSRDDVVLQKTPVTFDVSGWEFFWPLIAGARSVHVAEDDHRDPTAVAEAVRAHRVTVCHFVPSVLEEFLRFADPTACASLRHVFCSGEALPAVLAVRFVRAFGAELHNLYGPTEAAIDVTHWTVPRSISPVDTVFIGRPVDNTVLIVVGEDGTPMPRGEAGELLIGGTQVALGYANRPERTASAFVERFGTRWYATGDVVRVVEDQVEYLGRKDDQVKVRGVRVEPGEVEAALGEHPAVGQAVVVAVDAAGTTGNELLAALTPTSFQRPTDAELRAFLDERLPAAMVPSGFRWFDRLPLTSSGKADRRSLRDLLANWRRSNREEPGADPVADLWWDLLHRPETGHGADSGFLDLGGHSLLAARLIGRAAEELGTRVPFALLLRENATLDRFRRYVAGIGAAAGAERATGPVRVPRRTPLAPGQRRLWLMHQVNPLSPAYNVVVALRIDGRVWAGTLRAALNRLVERHDALRAGVRLDTAGLPELHFADSARLELELHRVSALDGAVAEAFVRRLADRPIPLTEAPMATAGLVLADRDDAACLVLCLHHLIADQHSADLLVAELFAHYEAELSGQAVALPPAPSYAGFAALPAADVRTRLDHWEEVLTGIPAELDLPFRASGTDSAATRARSQRRAFGPQLSAGLIDTARTRGATPATFVLAAVTAVLSAWSGQSTVVVGVPASRRYTADEHRLVGFLVDTLPVRVDFRADATFADLLDHVHRRHVDALDHAVPEFDDVVDRLGAPRKANANPVFQVWFNDLSQAAPPPESPGLRITHLDLPTGHALFDTNFYLRRGQDGGYVLELVEPEASTTVEAGGEELLDQCLLVLSQVLDRLDTPLAELDLRTGRPDRVVVGEPWSTVRQPIALLADRILRIAAEQPNAPAFVEADRVLPYHWLAESTGRVEAVLADRGVHAGAVVEVRSARVSWLAPVLLGIWRRGAVAALVDGSLPAQRLADLAELVRPAVSLAVPVDSRAEPSVEPGASSPRSLEGAGHVLFTSGSTGGPAAVVAPDTALADAMAWYQAEFGLTRADRTALLSGPGHDPVLRDLLGPLLRGGSVAVPTPATLDSPLSLVGFLRDRMPTVLHATPALLELLVAARRDQPGLRLPVLRLVVSGGAPLHASLVRELRGITDAEVVNAYGTTETPQVVARYRVGTGDLAAGGPGIGDALPIGTGVGGAELSVVTVTDKPAGVGQLGELVVTATRLASGYLEGTVAPERFAEAVRPGYRSFRTGDLARVDPSGSVRLYGRRDRQVLVNGHRVLLDEVEAAALAHPRVREARADAVDVAGSQVVALRVAGSSAEPPDAGEVRAHLRVVLPAAMVPSRIEVVTGPPGTANRKSATGTWTGLAAGPAEDTAEPGARQAVVDEVGRLVGRTVDDSENFFDAGLNSISLLRLHSALEERFGPFPVMALFQHTTISGLAGFLSGERSGDRVGKRRTAVPATTERPTNLREAAGRRRALRRKIYEGDGEK